MKYPEVWCLKTTLSVDHKNKIQISKTKIAWLLSLEYCIMYTHS